MVIESEGSEGTVSLFDPNYGHSTEAVTLIKSYQVMPYLMSFSKRGPLTSQGCIFQLFLDILVTVSLNSIPAFLPVG